MLSPRRLALVVAMALVAPPAMAVAEGRPRPAATAAAKAKAAKVAKAKAARAAKLAKAAKRKRALRAKARRDRGRVAAKRGRPARVTGVAANMPEGWEWPPSASMNAAGLACTSKLTELGVEWEPADAIERIATPITVPSMTFGAVKVVSWFRKPPFVMDCHLALALTVFAKDLYELGVRELIFSRIYGYTQVRAGGVTKNALSRHALGLAIDVRAVIDADGREAQVVRDYKLDDPLLIRLEEFFNDSGGFRTVLTPKNDPVSHHDHFHVEVKLEYVP